MRLRTIAPAVLLASACTSRAGEAEVRLQGGQPCFGVSVSETRSGDKVLDGLTLQEGSATIWSVAKEDPMRGVHLSQTRCLWFGETPPGYGGSPPSALLREGVVYELAVKATREGESRSVLHGARFCLADPVGGGSGFARVIPRPANATSCGDP